MKQSLTQKSFEKAVKETRALPWKHNWDIDKQLGDLTATQYQALARELRIEMLETVKDLLSLAPKSVLKDDGEPPHYRFYALKDMEGLIAEIKANPDDKRFLKSTESIAEKMYTPNVNHTASNIGDYLRFQILSNDIDEIVKLRAILLKEDSPLTSYKDQLRRPCDEGGHRAFKFHMEVKKAKEEDEKAETKVGKAKKILVEGQIGHLGLEELDLTKYLRNAERHLQDVFRTAAAELDPYLRPVVLAGMNTASQNFLKARLAVNYHEARALGLDVLLDKTVNTQKEIDNALSCIDDKDPHARIYMERSTSMRRASELLQSRTCH